MKYYGKIGFSETIQTDIDVWETKIVYYLYAGDIKRVSTGWQTADQQINDDLSVSMELSFVGDVHALQNFNSIRCVEWRGTKWKVTNVHEEHPRIILTLGGEYNGD